MSETIKIEIEIPAPPEGCGEVEYRRGVPGEYLLDSGKWVYCDYYTNETYPVASKLAPPWTPPPELINFLKSGWLTRDKFGVHALHAVKPQPKESHWRSTGQEWRLNAIRPIFLPPLTIPWDKCCFKIGEPDE